MSTWVAYIYDPKRKKTRSRIVRSSEDSSMGNAPAVAWDVAKKLGVPVDRVLALPKRGRILRRRPKRRSKHRRSR